MSRLDRLKLIRGGRISTALKKKLKGGYGTVEGAMKNKWIEALRIAGSRYGAQMIYNKDTKSIDMDLAMQYGYIEPDEVQILDKVVNGNDQTESENLREELIEEILTEPEKEVLDILQEELVPQDVEPEDIFDIFEEKLEEPEQVVFEEPLEEIIEEKVEEAICEQVQEDEEIVQDLLEEVVDALEKVEDVEEIDTIIEDLQDLEGGLLIGGRRKRGGYLKGGLLIGGRRKRGRGLIGGKKKRKLTEWMKAVKMAGSIDKAKKIYDKKTKMIDKKKAKKMGYI